MAETSHQAVPSAAPVSAPLATSLPSGLSDQRVKGIGFLVLGIAVFSLQDVILKFLSGGYPIHEALTIRSLTALPVLLAMVVVDGGLRFLGTKRPLAVLGRGCIMFTAYASYYLGLASLPIATCIALYFTAPLFITILSVFVLGEKVGPTRWAAVGIGFAGVLIMVRPGTEVFDWASLLPVYGGLAYGVSQIIARKLAASERSTVMGFYGNGVFLMAGLLLAGVLGGGDFANEEHRSLAFLLRGWAMPGTRDLVLMMSCGVIAGLGLVFLTQAYRVAPANVVAPFEYTALIWGVLYGWLIWRELPRPETWLGIAIVIGAGLVVLYRERRTGTPTLWRRAGWYRFRVRRTGGRRPVP